MIVNTIDFTLAVPTLPVFLVCVCGVIYRKTGDCVCASVGGGSVSGDGVSGGGGFLCRKSPCCVLSRAIWYAGSAGAGVGGGVDVDGGGSGGIVCRKPLRCVLPKFMLSPVIIPWPLLWLQLNVLPFIFIFIIFFLAFYIFILFYFFAFWIFTHTHPYKHISTQTRTHIKSDCEHY